MLLHIFNMIWAQRRTNGWIFAELVLAVCALWILADQVWVDVRCYQAPMGYDISNTWRFKLSALPTETTDEAVGDESSDQATDLLALMERIRQEAEVEEVAMCYWSMPYSYGNYWQGLFPLEGDTAGVHAESFHVLLVSPEYFDLFRMRDTPVCLTPSRPCGKAIPPWYAPLSADIMIKSTHCTARCVR